MLAVGYCTDRTSRAKQVEPLPGVQPGRLGVGHVTGAESLIGCVADAQLEVAAFCRIDRADHKSTARSLDHAPTRFSQLMGVHLQDVAVATLLLLTSSRPEQGRRCLEPALVQS
jgi:hypothetical protein